MDYIKFNIEKICADINLQITKIDIFFQLYDFLLKKYKIFLNNSSFSTELYLLCKMSLKCPNCKKKW